MFLSSLKTKTIQKSYCKFYKKNGYIPQYLDLYNAIEVKNGIHPTLTTSSNGKMGSGTVLVIE